MARSARWRAVSKAASQGGSGMAGGVGISRNVIPPDRRRFIAGNMDDGVTKIQAIPLARHDFPQ